MTHQLILQLFWHSQTTTNSAQTTTTNTCNPNVLTIPRCLILYRLCERTNAMNRPICVFKKTTLNPVFGATLDPSAMALMTDGEIPLTDSTNLLGPSSLMPISSYLNYGAATTTAPHPPPVPAPAASYVGPPITEADLQRFRNSGRKRSRHKRGGGGSGCPNSYSNTSFNYSNVEGSASIGGRTHSLATTRHRDSFRHTPPSSSTTHFGRERTNSGRTHKYKKHTPSPDQEICSSLTLTRTIFLPHPLSKNGKKGTEEERIHTKHKFKVGESLVQSAKEINHTFSITSTPDSAMRTIPR